MATRSIGGALSQILSETTIPIFAAKVILLFCKRQLYMKKNNKKCRFNVKSCKRVPRNSAKCLTSVFGHKKIDSECAIFAQKDMQTI